jgi:hypothetical protein
MMGLDYFIPFPVYVKLLCLLHFHTNILDKENSEAARKVKVKKKKVKLFS